LEINKSLLLHLVGSFILLYLTEATYVQRRTVARSSNYCCYVNTTMGSLCVFVHIYVAVNNIKRLNSATGTQELAPFALRTSYKSFRTADNTNLSLHVKCPTLLSTFNEISRASTDLRNSPKCKISSKSIQSQPR